MMRVAHVVSSLAVGGAERLVVDLARAQLAAGLVPSIIDLAREEGPLAEDARAGGLRVVSIGARSRVARLRVLVRELVRGADAVHLHNPWALRAVLPVLPAITSPVVYTRHGASPYAKTSWRIVHRFARRFVDHVTFVTPEARAAFETAHGSADDRHRVIPNGVAIPDPLPPRAVSPPLRVGVVGRLVELKGHHIVIEALAALGARVELHIFGDGPERERLHELAADRPVVFHGFVIDREEIYSNIDALVVASRTEGQSMVIVEAMARGLPVIATAVGGNTELVLDGETGLIVPYGDPGALRDAISQLVARPELIETFGRAGRAHAAAHHAIEHVVASYSAVYAGA